MGKNKRHVKTWSLISLLNVDYKIASKALSTSLKKFLPLLLLSEKTVQGSFTAETGRLISDVTEVTNLRKIEGILVTMDIAKAFDSLDHLFFMSVFKKIGFGKNFMT